MEPSNRLEDVSLAVAGPNLTNPSPKVRSTSCKVILLSIGLFAFGISGIAGCFGVSAAGLASITPPTWAVAATAVGLPGTATITAMGIKLLADAKHLEENLDDARKILEEERKNTNAQQRIADEQRKRLAALESAAKRIEVLPKELQDKIDALESALKKSEAALQEHNTAREQQTVRIQELVSQLENLNILNRSASEYLEKLSTSLETTNADKQLNLNDLQAVEERLKKQILDVEKNQKQTATAHNNHIKKFQLIYNKILNLISNSNKNLAALAHDKAILIEKANKARGTIDSEQGEVEALIKALQQEKFDLQKALKEQEAGNAKLQAQLTNLQPLLSFSLRELQKLNGAS